MPTLSSHLITTQQQQVEVIVHPLVLLSTVDHYNRVAKDTRKRVVGVLLGTTWRGRIDITNSFAGTSSLLLPPTHPPTHPPTDTHPPT